jgi:hypothetical protein
LLKTTNMRKLFILIWGLGAAINGMAQRTSGSYKLAPEGTVSNRIFLNNSSATARTSGLGGTDTLSNVTDLTTATIYYAGTGSDTGYVSGTDIFGDMGYAERYDFNGVDSSLKVIGLITLFGGSVNPASTKTVTFYTWSMGPEVPVSTNVYESGLPYQALDSVSVPFTQLGIATVDTLADTFKAFMFTTPTAYLDTSFFVGYTVNYNFGTLDGDTIAVYTSMDGDRTSPVIYTTGVDTIINNQNTTLYNDGSGWHDNATDDFVMNIDYFMFPIVDVGLGANSAGVNSVTKNKLTFYGNYPNPATDCTNITFSLATSADVTIFITDLNGKIINTIQQPGMATGMHNVPVETTNLASGNYLYVIRTSAGDGIAAKFTVAH